MSLRSSSLSATCKDENSSSQTAGLLHLPRKTKDGPIQSFSLLRQLTPSHPPEQPLVFLFRPRQETQRVPPSFCGLNVRLLFYALPALGLPRTPGRDPPHQILWTQWTHQKLETGWGRQTACTGTLGFQRFQELWTSRQGSLLCGFLASTSWQP